MEVIAATEAKARLAELLRAVEAGDSFAITRHGKAIAHIVPVENDEKQARRQAVERFRKARKNWRKTDITLEELLEWRHEGHRY